MPTQTLDQWLTLLEKRHPTDIELGLNRVAEVARRLALPLPARRVVSVAGTNGKGSCVRYLENLLTARGLRVGSYTSPHILRYNERIRIAGHVAGDSDIVHAFEAIEAARGEISLTYFEMGTLAALQLMASADLDVAVLEVGLGGRLDAVNLVDADIAVITPIAVDHADWLGNSREVIALEKAGIARAGKPLVCADPEPPSTLVDHLAARAVPTLYLDSHFGSSPDAAGGMSLWYTGADGERRQLGQLPRPGLPLPSALAAVQAAAALDLLPEQDAVARVLTETVLEGRFQRLRLAGRDVVCDVAHNPAAAGYLAGQLKASDRRVVLVAAIMADKDRAGLVAALNPVVEHWYLGDLGQVPRALPASELAETVIAAGGEVTLADSLEGAFRRALSHTGQDDLIAVCGSFHTVSAVMAIAGELESDEERA